MSDFPFPQPNPENVELAAANRRLTTAILGMTLLCGLIACLSYLAGRTVTHIRSETATVVRTEVPPAPVVVTPSSQIEPFKPSPAAAPPVATGLYLQVGLVNLATDPSLRDRLLQRGFQVKTVPMENSPVSRLVIGPIQSAAQQSELSAKLQAEGYQFFPRRM